MAISYVNKGAFTSGTGALTVGVPSSYADDDLLVLLVESANQAIVTPSGWTQVSGSPRYTGTAAAAGGVRLAMFYKFVSGTQSSVSVADSGDHTTAIMLCFRGVDTSNPIDVSSGDIKTAASTSSTFPAISPSKPNCMILGALGQDRDTTSTSNVSSFTNTSLTSINKRHDQVVSSGVGGGLACFTGMFAGTGSIGTTTANLAASQITVCIIVALRPAPELRIIPNSTDAINTTASAALSVIRNISISDTLSMSAVVALLAIRNIVLADTLEMLGDAALQLIVPPRVVLSVDSLLTMGIRGALTEGTIFTLDMDGNLEVSSLIEGAEISVAADLSLTAVTFKEGEI